MFGKLSVHVHGLNEKHFPLFHWNQTRFWHANKCQNESGSQWTNQKCSSTLTPSMHLNLTKHEKAKQPTPNWNTRWVRELLCYALCSPHPQFFVCSIGHKPEIGAPTNLACRLLTCLNLCFPWLMRYCVHWMPVLITFPCLVIRSFDTTVNECQILIIILQWTYHSVI